MTAGFRLPREFYLVRWVVIVAAGWLFCNHFCTAFALEPREYAIEASAEVLSAPFALRLTWEPSVYSRTYTIRRRAVGARDWGDTIATLPAGSTQYVDTNVAEGNAYEYEIRLETTQRGAGGWVNAYGYVLAGGKVTWPDQKGKILVLVDDILAASLSAEINSFLRDLTGSGWMPIRRDLARTSTVPEVKSLIRAEYNADPANVRSVILLGHLPVPYSGNIAPDLHESHRGAWPADVFYADVDGNWTDSVVNINSGDYDANDNWIGDGKFDQSQIPSEVELELGRIDFHDLPAFANRSQTEHFKSYLQRNSQFRHRTFTASRRMLVRDNFGDLSGDAPGVDAWRHYRPFFGPGAVREVGAGGFFSTLQNESFLWAYGCGGGGNTKADGVGSTADFATQSPRAVFMVLHGSYFGDWNTKDNFLRAATATSGQTLASIWSGLPHWFMHSMGLGKSVGFVTRQAQNNVSDYRSHLNFGAQQVHISLIGDPTLENFPVIPPRNLSGTASGNVELNWAASPDENIVGYHVYYSASATGPFRRITTSALGSTSYSHSVGTGTHNYMVRAVKLERTGSGTFYNLSQGIFASVTKSTGGTLPQVNILTLDSDASEIGPNNASVTVTRSFADANPLRVEILAGGTAQEGIDYTAIGTAITIPASATEVVFPIVPISDNLVEGPESVAIQIRPSANYSLGSSSAATLTIADGINHSPTISQVPDQTVAAGTSSSNLVFQVADTESAPTALQVRAKSSNEQLLPLSGILLGGNGSTRTVRISPPGTSGGFVTVTLVASDGVNEASSSFNVTVLPANQPPTAIPQALEIYENEPVAIRLTGQDPEAQSLTYAIQVPPSNGALTGTPPNVTYLPRTNFFGTDVFSFTVNDGTGASAPAEVSIRINERNKPPVVSAAQTNIFEDTVQNLTLKGTDPNGDHLLFEVIQYPTNGILTAVTNGWYQYQPATNFNGFDSFTFRAFDGGLYSPAARYELTVFGANDVPTTAGQLITSLEDEAVAIRLIAADVDGDPLTFELVTSPVNGVLSGTLPDLVYRPNSNFFGSDAFTYFVRDGISTSSIATVSITVEAVNDLPEAASFNAETFEDTNVSIKLLGSDVEDSDLAYFVTALPVSGVLSGVGPNFDYSPAANFNGEDFLKYVVTDGMATSQVATVRIIVKPTDDPPSLGAIPDLSCRKNGFAGPLALSIEDIDTPLSELQLWAESSNAQLLPTNRIAFVPGDTNRQIKLWPSANMTGVSTITVHVSDRATSVATQFLITVTNTPPNARDDEILESVGSLVIPVSRLLANDGDLDNEPISIAAVYASSLGCNVVLSNATVIYHGTGDAARDSFVYEIQDSSGARSSAVVRLSLTEDPRIAWLSVIEGNVRLGVVGKAGSTFTVLSSVDGRTWEVRGTGTSDELGRGEFIESGGANAHHRFYRTEWP